MTAKMKHLITALIASAAVGQAAHAQEAPSAVAQDTKQVEQAADGMANKVAGWLDKLSDSVRTLGEKKRRMVQGRRHVQGSAERTVALYQRAI